MSRSSAREALAVIGAFGAVAVVATRPLVLRLGDALPVVVYNLAYLASYVLAGGGMYLLALSLTRSRPAAAVAGVLFVFVPFRAQEAGQGGDYGSDVRAMYGTLTHRHPVMNGATGFFPPLYWFFYYSGALGSFDDSCHQCRVASGRRRPASDNLFGIQCS